MPGGGGLLELVAKGQQDVFLTGNPQVSWFRMIYNRYTNFAVESKPIYFDGMPNFGKRISCIIPKDGDLLGPLFLEITLPALTYSNGTPVKWTNTIGHAIIKEISIEIGEKEIDRQTGEWMEIWSRYTIPESQKQGFYNMTGKTDSYNPAAIFNTLYVPLQFWFCRKGEASCYLPILALQYHQVRINLTLRPIEEVIIPDPDAATNPVIPCTPILNPAITPLDITLYGDYVYLDTEERRRFVSSAREYLIEQVQYTSTPYFIKETVSSATIPTEFTHPIKEFFWYLQRDDIAKGLEWFNYSSLGVSETGIREDLMTSAVIQFDGFDRFYKRDAGYFRLVQPYQHHTSIPIESFIYSYSLALKPEDLQPSGSANASRIDSLVFQLDLNTTTTPPRGNIHCWIYAINHNVLRIIDGFGLLLFSA